MTAVAAVDLAPLARGRPSKFTPANQAAILANIAAGLLLKDAVADIPDPIEYATFANWMSDARERGEASPYFDFFQAVKRAEVQAKRKHRDNIERHSDRDWKASAWVLSHQWPEDYAVQSQLRITHEGSVTHTHVHVLTPPNLNQVFELLGAPDAIDGEAHEAL